jgi:hypothetical protein
MLTANRFDFVANLGLEEVKIGLLNGNAIDASDLQSRAQVV